MSEISMGPLAEVGTPGEVDPTYDLIGVLYHCTRTAGRCDEFIKAAEQDHDQQLAEFFREVQEQNTRRAMRAKQLLRQRL